MAETGDQVPQVSQGSEIAMAPHQVNADGGDPYTCAMNADGNGAQWANIQVTQSPPGQNSRLSDGAMNDFPRNAAIPADASCTGTVAGQDNVCLVRCMNAARAGPFDGVVPVQSKSSNLAAAQTSSFTSSIVANTTTPTQARRALAKAVKRSEGEPRTKM